MLVVDIIIIDNRQWLTSTIIDAAQLLLKRKASGINGWQSTELGRNSNQFKVTASPLVQFHVNGNHWLVVSTVNCTPETVNIYDSAYTLVRCNTKLQISTFHRPSTPNLYFQSLDIQRQTNSKDCGVYAIANATALVLGKDPVLYNWDRKQMRSHLISCFEQQDFKLFPFSSLRRSRGNFAKRVDEEKIFCICRTINNPIKGMIKCDSCRNWYHLECVKLFDAKEKWYCSICSKN